MDNGQDANNPSSYFLSDQELERAQKKDEQVRQVKHYAVQVWPYVNRFLTFAVYGVLGLFKSMVKMAIEQIKNFKA